MASSGARADVAGSGGLRERHQGGHGHQCQARGAQAQAGLKSVFHAAARQNISAEEEASALHHGLSTTVAHERLVEEVELIVDKFLGQVKAVTWKSRLGCLSIPQSFEAAVALICSVFLAAAATILLDTTIFAEVLLVLLAHFLAWYISFRLPRVEQLRAIAKVQECIQKFVASGDAFTRTTRGASGGSAEDAGCFTHDALPPSSFCVSVLRDRVWRQIPYNMVVVGDIFRLRDGEVFPCRAESLSVRAHGAVPSGEAFSVGQTFSSAAEEGEAAAVGGKSSGSPSAAAKAPKLVGSFRALRTACVPTVTRFLEKAQRPSEGRTDTFFFELAELVRSRLKRISLAIFLVTTTVVCLWMFRPEVAEQAMHWHLRRALVPLRLVVCLLPLMHTIMLQITDVWGNARIQSLFEWHAGLADDERGHGHVKPSEEVSPGSGEIDASRVPLQRQLRELVDILRQGLDGPSNLMHTLNSTTVVCFCDKEGLLTDTCTTISEVCLCSSSTATRKPSNETPVEKAGQPAGDGHRGKMGYSESSQGGGNQAAAETGEGTEEMRKLVGGDDTRGLKPATDLQRLQTVVLDVQQDTSAFCGLRFEDSDWRQLLPMLKPLGLAMAVSRQPRELPLSRGEDAESSLYNLSVNDVLHAIHRGGSNAAMGDCLCNVSKLVGFKDEVIKGFTDVKFCVELWRPLKVAQQLAANEQVEQCSPPGSSPPPSCRKRSTASDNLGFGVAPAVLGQPSLMARAGSGISQIGGERERTCSGGDGSVGEPMTASLHDEDFEHTGFGMPAEIGMPSFDSASEPSHQFRKSATNYSRTLMTWFVHDSRDSSLQMFCKAKPKRLLPRCTHYFDGSRVVPLREEDKQDLLRLVLQWKASGLSALAYAYRPLGTPAELEVAERLSRTNFFCSSETKEGTSEVVQVSGGATPSYANNCSLADDLAELQADQVLLGMAGMKLCASVQMSSYAEALNHAGIRFQVYCCEGEKRTRTLGSQLGLETGWNCLISLERITKVVKNMMGQVVLPSGIPDIRRHTKEVDNVPLLVSLFSKATPWRAQQMIDILQENSECVTCVGSALQPNFETFRQANISVSVLVGAVPRCRRCLGQREPRDGAPGSSDRDLLLPGTVNKAEFQLSADLTSLPCALQARHSYKNGEQRTLGVLFNAIKEARRCVDCILMVLIHYLCGAVELAVIIALQALLCLPAPLEGIHVIALLLILLPAISLALLFNAASPQLMRELPLKKADEKTLAQPGRLMRLYALRSIPTAVVVVAAFVHDLHHVFLGQLEKARGQMMQEELVRICEDFTWHWWLTGRWPKCVSALSRASAADPGGLFAKGDTQVVPFGAGGSELSCALVRSQQWGAFLFLVNEVTLAFTFLDRYDSLWTRGPPSNKVLCGAAALALLLHSVASFLVVSVSCEYHWQALRPPSWEVWLVCVGVWPAMAVALSECTKQSDRKYHNHLQRTLRVLFNTRLGMWSPK